LNIKHYYTDDYWTCHRIDFASREQLTCAIIGSNLLPSANRNRYWPYVLQVQADPHVAYVLLRDDPQSAFIVRNAHLAIGNDLRVELYGYMIYQLKWWAKKTGLSVIHQKTIWQSTSCSFRGQYLRLTQTPAILSRFTSLCRDQ
jgi:hypothetical protein